MKKLISIISASFVASPIFANSASDNKSAQSASINIKSQPNIVLIYADDIGYGDLSSYGAKQVNTPNTDTLAANGIRFTNAHSAAATSTPSRYGLFTGEYPWRRRGTGVANGDAALIINPDRELSQKCCNRWDTLQEQ